MLFLLLTYEIIHTLESVNVGFKNDFFFIIPILYFANDRLILPNSV